MKTTVELSDDLLDHARRLARREGTSLRALLEDGLRLVFKTRQQRPARNLRIPAYGEGGLSDAFRDAGWEAVRDEIYRDRR
jgi:hypothetical protein